MTTLVPYQWEVAGARWVSPGRPPMVAVVVDPPPDPDPVVFTLDDPESLLDGPKVLG
jgi:hypothetical protein